MKVKFTIETSTLIRIILVVIGFVLSLALIWVLRHALMLIVLSFFLALALNPPVSFLAARMPRDSRALGTGLAYLIVIFLIGSFVYMAIPPLLNDSRELLDRLPQYVDELNSQDGYIGDVVRNYNLDIESREFVNSFASRIGNADGPVLNSLSKVSSSLVTMLTVLVLTFLMLVEGPTWLNLLWSIYPNDKEEKHRVLAQKMYAVVTGYVNGQLLTALIAAISSLIFMILVARIDPSTALPLAGIVGLAGLVPLIGTTIGSVLVILVALLNSLGSALAMLIFFVIYQQIENNFIQPYIQSRTIDMSPLLVLVSVIIGFESGGFIGALLSIPVAGMIRVLIMHYYEHILIGANDKLKEKKKKRKFSFQKAQS